jgi:hypothetical protein
MYPVMEVQELVGRTARGRSFLAVKLDLGDVDDSLAGSIK